MNIWSFLIIWSFMIKWSIIKLRSLHLPVVGITTVVPSMKASLWWAMHSLKCALHEATRLVGSISKFYHAWNGTSLNLRFWCGSGDANWEITFLPKVVLLTLSGLSCHRNLYSQLEVTLLFLWHTLQQFNAVPCQWLVDPHGSACSFNQGSHM